MTYKWGYRTYKSSAFAVGECVCRWGIAFAVGERVCRWAGTFAVGSSFGHEDNQNTIASNVQANLQ